MLCRFLPGGLQHTRPHTWHGMYWKFTNETVTSLRCKTSLSLFHISSPFWSRLNTRHRLPPQKLHSHFWIPPCGKRHMYVFWRKKCIVLELASVFVPVVVHCSAIAILKTVLPTTNIDSSATEMEKFFKEIGLNPNRHTSGSEAACWVLMFSPT